MESKSSPRHELKNPYTSQEGYNCFGCSPDNYQGLRMKFVLEGETVICSWIPTADFQGWNKVLHGGIQATLIDEIASWFLFTVIKKGGVTSRLDVRYRKPVPIDRGPLKLVATLEEMKRNIAVMKVLLYGPDNELCTEGLVNYFCFSEERATQQLNYPGAEAFLP